MSTLTIRPGGAWEKDPQSSKVITFDWASYFLPAGVEITASVWTIAGPDAVLTKDNESLAAGNRQTKVRLIGGTAGVTYTVSNKITTNETPQQIDERSFEVRVRNL